MKRKYLNWLMVLVLIPALLFAGCGKQGESATPTTKVYNWDLYTIASSTSVMGKYFIAFADDVKKRTNGRLNITVRTPGESPFKPEEAIKIVSNNSVQISDVLTSYTAGDSKIAGLATLPYLIQNKDEYIKAYDALLPFFEKEMKPRGVEVLFWNTYPPSSFWGKGTPISSLKDIKGKKMRAQNAQTSEVFTRLGATPVTFTTQEVPSAMQRGLAEGMLTSKLGAWDLKWYEFLDWGYLSYTGGGWSYVAVNSKAMSELPDDLKKILKDTSNEWSKKMVDEVFANDEAMIAKLEGVGMKMIRPTASDQEYAISGIKDYWEKSAKEGGPEVEAGLAAMRKALNK